MKNDVVIVQELVVKDFNIEHPNEPQLTIERLTIWLAGEISRMMDQDFQNLLNILYRIDVSEESTKVALASDRPADELAKLIVERELQKVETRKRYRSE